MSKQNEAYEARVGELKRVSGEEQAEIKALRARLRACEHERGLREAESGDAKAALECAEARWKGEINERDVKVAELEKTLVGERTRREMLEACLDDVRKKADEEGERLRADSTRLQQKLDTAQKDGQEARRAACATRDEAEDREEGLLMQLEYYKTALGRVAEEYAQLASTTVPAKAHASLKEEHFALQSCSLRLERKLANSEAQVTELAHLIRQANDESKFLLQQLREAEETLDLYSRLLKENNLDRFDGRDDDTPSLENKLALLGLDIAQGHAFASLVEYHETAHGFYRDLADELQLQVSDLENDVRKERATNRGLTEEVARHVALCEASSVELQRLQTELAEASRHLASEQGTVAQMRQSQDALQQQMSAVQKQLGEQVSQHKAALQKEREIAQKLSMQLGMSKTAEDTLKAEIEQ